MGASAGLGVVGSVKVHRHRLAGGVAEPRDKGADVVGLSGLQHPEDGRTIEESESVIRERESPTGTSGHQRSTLATMRTYGESREICDERERAMSER